MTGAVLAIDLDSVLMPPVESWRADLERDWGIAPEAFADGFLRASFREALRGRLDLYQAVDEYLSGVGVDGRAVEFVTWWFERAPAPDSGLLARVDAWRRGTGGRVFVIANQEHHRIDHLRRSGDIDDHVDEILYSAALGVCKPDRVFFTNAQARMGVAAGRAIACFDADRDSVDAARTCGWRAFLYRDRRQLAEFLDAGA